MPIAKWFWYNDNNWVQYDEKTSKKLEAGFLGGITEIKADEERYVQIVNTSELKRNFLKIPSKDLPCCIGIQRRYDDPMKRRIVKRESSVSKTLFSGLTFYICTGRKKTMLKQKEGKDLEDGVKEFGGSCVKDLSSNPTYVVMKAGDTASLDEVKKAQTAAHIVNDNFITYCIKHNKVLDFKMFAKVDGPLSDDEEEKLRNLLVKDDNDDDEEEEEDEKKKAVKSSSKKDDEVPLSSPPPAKKVAIDSSASTTNSGQAPALKIECNGTFMGTCIYIQTNEMFTFNIEVTSVTGGAFEGVVTWTTLNNAKTKCRGSIDDKGAFKLEEYAVIQGEDDVEVPSRYEGELKDGKINGSVTSSTESTTFFLIYKSPQHPIDMLRGGASFSGVLKLEIPYTISIKPGDSDIAVINYTSAVGSYSTEARIAKKDDGLAVNEFAEVPGGVSKVVPRSYVLTNGGDSGKMTGTITVPNYATGAATNYGTAELFLQSK